jgi:hypothetical protein
VGSSAANWYRGIVVGNSWRCDPSTRRGSPHLVPGEARPLVFSEAMEAAMAELKPSLELDMIPQH